MIKIGIIGFGSMGSMIASSILAKSFIKPDELIISSRTKSKIDPIKEKWKGIKISGNKTVSQKAKYIFICVKPFEVKDVLDEIKSFVTADKHLVSIAASVTLNNLESKLDRQITRVIPSITSEVFEGVTLICHNKKVSPENRRFIEDLFDCISSVKIIKEVNFEAASDLTSSAPGMIAAIFQNLLNAGLRHSSLKESDALEMITKTLYGTAKLLQETKMNFGEVIARVATKGGVTEQGNRVLNAFLPELFDKVFTSTLNKHEERKDKVDQMFKG